MTIDELNNIIWNGLKTLADNGTLPITGEVYNGDRDLNAVSEDVTVKSVFVRTPYEHTQRADVNVNVFTGDTPKGGNRYVPNEARLSVLSGVVSEYIKSIDYTQTNIAVTEYSETTIEEPSLRQHYRNFLISVNIYD